MCQVVDTAVVVGRGEKRVSVVAVGDGGRVKLRMAAGRVGVLIYSAQTGSSCISRAPLRDRR